MTETSKDTKCACESYVPVTQGCSPPKRVRPVTKTDAYKLSMAEAGFPLRYETFYYTHRKGGMNGWHYMPIDPKAFVKSALPSKNQTADDYAYLDLHTYSVGAATRKAFSLASEVEINAIPKGSWFYNREPAFSVSGASAVASWLEPTALQLHFVVQVATQAKIWKLPAKMIATCEDERDLIVSTCEAVGCKPPEIEVHSDEFYEGILAKAKALVEAVGGNPDRIFEVGMRGVSCMAQHRIALQAIKAVGILRTSNIFLAQELGMIPVGTMGHEHPQRFGADYPSYTTMRDRFPGFISYLPDTYDSIRSGIPAALKAIQERPDRKAGIRFDSEERIKNHYFYTITECLRLGLNPQLILESGWDLAKTIEFEQYREMMKWPADQQSYGFGGYLVEPTWDSFTRDTVAAVWKLTQSGGKACMKFGDEANSGKQSAPGFPMIFRPHPMEAVGSMPVGMIGQRGEEIPKHYCLTDSNSSVFTPDFKTPAIPPIYSPATQRLVDICQANRQANFNISL